MNNLLNKIYNNKRISFNEAEDLFQLDFLELGKAADFRRKAAFPAEKVGFIIDRIINYTNVCEVKCDFCAFCRDTEDAGSFALTKDQVLKKVSELNDIGGTQVMLQGGLNSSIEFNFIQDLISLIRKKYPKIILHSFSPAEIYYFAKNENKTIGDILNILYNLGIRSVPGASDLLVDRIRQKYFSTKISTEDWCNFVRAISDRGMTTTATMTYGMGETYKEKIEHLEVIRKMQDETGVIKAFIPWSFSPNNTKLNHLRRSTAMDYLKIVAIARIYLDNVVYIQSGWLTEGFEISQLSLKMGANDMGGILMEEQVVRSTGVKRKTDCEKVVNLIRSTGKTPYQRDSKYDLIRDFNNV